MTCENRPRNGSLTAQTSSALNRHLHQCPQPLSACSCGRSVRLLILRSLVRAQVGVPNKARPCERSQGLFAFGNEEVVRHRPSNRNRRHVRACTCPRPPDSPSTCTPGSTVGRRGGADLDPRRQPIDIVGLAEGCKPRGSWLCDVRAVPLTPEGGSITNRSVNFGIPLVASHGGRPRSRATLQWQQSR